jgi:hypothetical protein
MRRDGKPTRAFSTTFTMNTRNPLPFLLSTTLILGTSTASALAA